MKLNRKLLRRMILSEIKRNLYEGLDVQEKGILQSYAFSAQQRPNGKEARLLVDILNGMKSSDIDKFDDAMADDTIRTAYEAVSKHRNQGKRGKKGDIIDRALENFADGASKSLERSLGLGPMSPRILRKKLRGLFIGVKSGYTAYAKHKPSGKKGILVFGLDEEDLAKKNKLTSIKVLNQHHKPHGKKGIKSIRMYPNSEAKNFELIGGSATIKSIKDDKPFINDAKFSFQDYLTKDLEGEVFLYELE